MRIHIVARGRADFDRIGMKARDDRRVHGVRRTERTVEKPDHPYRSARDSRSRSPRYGRHRLRLQQLISRGMIGRWIFIGNCWRKGGNRHAFPQRLRARWRARPASRGHNPAAGNFSARYSRIASESQTCVSPSIRTGTLPAPLMASSRFLKSGALSEISVSSNAIPATFIANHGRNDHDE